MEIEEILSLIGDKVSNVSGKIIQYISNLGVNVTNFQSKLVSLVIILILLYLIIKVISIPKKSLKIAIIIILIILAVSIAFSLFSQP